ncbi:Phytoene synthase [invertebrate metagenome]|uniref:Phytoene synthase n=1 Tax=invertebrate metagenome TaxID=1711999 RepID=A0A484H667_9ZZZZ
MWNSKLLAEEASAMFSNAIEMVRLTGKTQRDENFPVGSFLLSKTVRPLIAAFYRFARTADDLADDPVLDSQTKLAKLDTMDSALQGLSPVPAWAQSAWHLRQLLLQHSGLFSVDQPRALLLAFRRDAVNEDSRNWVDLLDYCRMSANPVGRFLLGIHYETNPAALTASDALCTALQVLNHLQDCHKDFTALNRVYVPADLLAAEGLDRTILGARKAPPGLLRVFNHMLDEVESLVMAAHHLPAAIACRRFRMEATVTLALALRLLHRLRHQDLLAHFYGLRRFDWIAAMGVAMGWQSPLKKFRAALLRAPESDCEQCRERPLPRCHDRNGE